MKRFFDLLVSISVFFLVLPFLLIIALVIKLDSKGPVIFKQTRIGLNGNCFSIYKFRSMVVDASNSGPYFTVHNDKRITRVGKLIRKTSLDELPQILNVVKGDMSIVGPRPNVPEQEKDYEKADWIKRNTVKPGVTGLAQAKLRSAATPEQRTALDLEYVDKTSTSMDLRIIMMTIKQVISKGGN